MNENGKSLEQWILFISPYETRTSKWEVEIFPNEESVIASVKNRDLTKEHYYLPLSHVLEMIQQEFDKEEN